MDWIAILGAIGVPTILGTVIPFLVTRHYKKKDEKELEKDDTRDRLKSLEKEHKNLAERHELDLDNINRELSNIKDILIILKNSEQAMLRDRIIQAYNHYYKEKKFMPIYARESLDHMYQEYHNLGGNGVIEDLVKKLYELPTEPDEEYMDDMELK